jgi:hypothetical protein
MPAQFYKPLFLSGFLAVSGMSTEAFAQPDCSKFFHNADGSWSPTLPIMMAGTNGANTIISPETRFRAGTRSLPGLDLGRYLDTHCSNSRVRIPSRP